VANFRRKNGVFSQKPMIDIFQKLQSSSLSKNANIFAKVFGENIFKIITSVPDSDMYAFASEDVNFRCLTS
jgi:hypothetical protein